jgi:hypothetical protein
MYYSNRKFPESNTNSQLKLFFKKNARNQHNKIKKKVGHVPLLPAPCIDPAVINLALCLSAEQLTDVPWRAICTTRGAICALQKKSSCLWPAGCWHLMGKSGVGAGCGKVLALLDFST